VYSGRAGEAQKVVESLLKDMALRWRLAEIIPGEDDISILEYLVRLKDHVPGGALLDAVRKGGRTCESRRAAIARGPEEKEIACNAEAIRLRTSACSSLRRVGTGACRPLFQSDELIEFTL